MTEPKCKGNVIFRKEHKNKQSSKKAYKNLIIPCVCISEGNKNTLYFLWFKGFLYRLWELWIYSVLFLSVQMCTLVERPRNCYTFICQLKVVRDV